MKTGKTYSTDKLLFIALMCAFTASVLMVLLLGVRIYKSISSSSELTYSERTCISYVAEKIRHNDENGMVYVSDFDGLNALYLESKNDNGTYTDILYCNDGWLYELFCEKGAKFSRADGTQIINADSVSFSETEPGFFYIEVTNPKGYISRLNVSLRSGG